MSQVVDACVPVFYLRPVQDMKETKEQGRPVFRDVEYVEILIPGNSRDVHHARVEDEHRQRWPDQYRKWKDQGQIASTGTPLEMWPILLPSQVAQLKAMNIPTVEALADVDDANLQNLGPGARALVNKAIAYIDAAKGGASVMANAEENEKMKETIKQQSEEIAALKAQVNALAEMAQPDEKPKRKKKDVA